MAHSQARELVTQDYAALVTHALMLSRSCLYYRKNTRSPSPHAGRLDHTRAPKGCARTGVLTYDWIKTGAGQRTLPCRLALEHSSRSH